MEYKPWMDFITPDDMPNDDLKFLAETAGIKSVLALIFSSPGLTVSIPKTAFKEVKERYILNNYDGRKYTINKMAVECDLSQRHVYKIIKEHLEKNKSPS